VVMAAATFLGGRSGEGQRAALDLVDSVRGLADVRGYGEFGDGEAHARGIASTRQTRIFRQSRQLVTKVRISASVGWGRGGPASEAKARKMRKTGMGQHYAGAAHGATKHRFAGNRD